MRSIILGLSLFSITNAAHAQSEVVVACTLTEGNQKQEVTEKFRADDQGRRVIGKIAGNVLSISYRTGFWENSFIVSSSTEDGTVQSVIVSASELDPKIEGSPFAVIFAKPGGPSGSLTCNLGKLKGLR